MPHDLAPIAMLYSWVLRMRDRATRHRVRWVALRISPPRHLEKVHALSPTLVHSASLRTHDMHLNVFEDLGLGLLLRSVRVGLGR